MRNFLTISLCLLAGSLSAQNPQKEIDEQVWKPFIASYASLNTEAFMALHSRDVVRTIRDDGSVIDFGTYAEVTANGNRHTQLTNNKRKLELRFNERWMGKGLAFETGVYKSETIKPSGLVTTFYGRFQVVLRLENGIWKILTDTDSSEGGSIGDKEFLSARPME